MNHCPPSRQESVEACLLFYSCSMHRPIRSSLVLLFSFGGVCVCVYVVFYDVGVFLLILKGSPHSCTLGWDVMGSS